MNHLQKKKIAFMSIVNSVKGFVRTITGALPLTLEGCVDEESIIDYTLYGQSVQDGTPTPDTPIEVESVGEYDEATGKYKIPIKASGKNLFDIDKAENGSIHDLSGDNLEKDNRARTNYIYVKAGTYCVSTISTSGGVRSSTICHAYSTPLETTHIGAVKATSGTILTETKAYSIFTILVDCYVRFLFLPMSDSSITDLNTNTLNDFKPQIERGDMPTDYEPYHEPVTTNIYLDEPLGEGQSINYKKDGLPTIPTFKGTSIISADTTIQPSNAEITYYSNVKE